jgi:hypothetical protein
VTTGGLGCAGRYRCIGKWCDLIEGPVGADVDHERRIARQTLGEADRFPLEELAAAHANGCSAIPEDIPGDAEARRDAVIVLLDQRGIRTRRTVRKRQIYAYRGKELPLVGARSCARYCENAVAGIPGIGFRFRRAPGRHAEVGPLVGEVATGIG